jgi:hypothetical protein
MVSHLIRSGFSGSPFLHPETHIWLSLHGRQEEEGRAIYRNVIILHTGEKKDADQHRDRRSLNAASHAD